MTTTVTCVRCGGQDPNCLACPKNATPPPPGVPQTLTLNAVLHGTSPQTVVAPKTPTNEVVFIFDSSGSMAHCFDTAKKKLVESVRKAGEESKKIGQDTFVTIFNFSNSASLRKEAISLPPDQAAQRAGDLRLIAHGTALNDAIVKGVEQAKLVEAHRDAILFVIITDGGETEHRPGFSDVASAIAKCNATGKYTFAFLCPPGTRQTVKTNYGASEGNIEEWENTTKGSYTMGETVTASLGNYYTNTRAAGQTMSTQFITKTTDLSQVKESDLAKKLQEVTSLYKPYTVAKQETIAPFVSDKTKRPYKLGDAFFQLMKTERVQATKEIAVMVKTGPDAGRVFTGPQVREVLGLPQGNTRLKPGNHSNFDIFVQSTSLNRILPLGTKVLVKK